MGQEYLEKQVDDPWASYKSPMVNPYTPLNTTGSLPEAREFRERDKRDCDCPLPMVSRKQHRALGRGAGIRFCCLARAMETFMELPEGTLYFWAEFTPDWEWNVSEMVDDGPDNKKQQGFPPEWLLKRFLDKGVEITGIEDYRGSLPELRGETYAA